MSEMSRAEEVFFAALDRPSSADRAAYLDVACAGDAALRAEVERLLAARLRVGGFLEPGSAAATTSTFEGGDPGATATHQPGVEAADAVIAGKYKLLQQIGEGGMGAVWMADQTEPVKRRVAVKLVRADRGQSKAILARFEAERQAIALMDHPNIAKLLDAGSTEAGQPFFVMELVRGVPLNEYCDARRLTVPDRLALFTQVCGAVQHAHQKGVIHRDLKPGNILVESHDGRPVPKVIDFGLAKATTGLQLTEHTLFTAFGSVLGTPLYMAPEQAAFNAVDVDTRADVYALGVILYELLTGTTPLARDTVKKAALDEMLKLIRDYDAPAPSARLSSADSTPAVAVNRQTQPAKLGRFVKGELDWIVLKALAKERDRRYETATGFATDVERFLNHEPVTAGPPTAGYRVRKFVRRNRPQVVAAGLVLLALVAGVVGTALGLVEARRQADVARDEADKKEEARAEEVRQRGIADAERAAAVAAAAMARKAKEEADDRRKEAETNLGYARKGNAILGSVFEGLEPKKIAESGRPLQDVLRENLTRAVKELEGSAIGDPLEVAAMQCILGRSLIGLGEGELAITVLTKVRATRAARLGPGHPDTLAAVNLLAAGYQEAGKLDRAIPLFQEALRLQTAALGPGHPDTLATMSNLAGGYVVADRPNEGVKLYEEVLRLQTAALGPGHPDTLATMSNLASGYRLAGRPDKAIPVHEEAARRTTAKFGPSHPSTLAAKNGLAEDYQEAGQFDKAVPIYEEVLRLRAATLGPEHPDTLVTMGDLAQCYQVAGPRDKAVPLLEQTVRSSTTRLGPDHPDTLIAMNNLALGYWAAGDATKALSLFEEARRQMIKKLGPDDPATLRNLNNLGACHRATGSVARAVQLLEEAVRRSAAALGPDHPDTLHAMNLLALSHLDAGDGAKAVQLLEEAVRRSAATLGPNHPDTLGRVNNLGRAYAKMRQGAKAAAAFARYVSGERQQLPKASTKLAAVLATVSFELLNAEQYAAAEELLREALAIREKEQPDAWTTFNTQSMLGSVLLGQKKYVEAEPILRKGYEGLKAREKAIPPQGSTRVPEALDRLVALYAATGKPDEAAKWRAERAKYPPPVEKAPPPRESK